MIRASCLSALLLCPVAAMAEPISASGTLAVGVTDTGTGLGALDLTVTLPITPRLDAEIGTYLFTLNGKRPHETYAALVWGRQWRIGVVRPAYDSVLPSVFAQTAPFLAYERAEYTRAHATVEAMRNTAVPWGLSWQQSYGQTDLAVSVHDAVKGKFRTLSAAFTHRGDGWEITAAIEPVWLRDGNYASTNAKIGGRAQLGDSSIGLALLHPEANDRPDALSFDVVMPTTDKWDMRAFAELTRDGRDDAYGIGVAYHLNADNSLSFAATDGEAGRALHLTLERRF